MLLAREALGSTAIGDGIAVPHVRNPVILHLDRPMITLCFLERPVEFGALDGQPVDTLFTLISPTVRAHLHLLSRLSFVLRNPAFQGTVLRQAAREEILRAADDAERHRMHRTVATHDPGGRRPGVALRRGPAGAAGGLLAISGVPGLFPAPAITLGFTPRDRPHRPRLPGWSLGRLPAAGDNGDARLAFPSPFAGLRSALGVDALSAWFAVPILLVGALGSIYGEAYWSARRHPRTCRRLRLCYGLLLASLVFVLLARDGSRSWWRGK